MEEVVRQSYGVRKPVCKCGTCKRCRWRAYYYKQKQEHPGVRQPRTGEGERKHRYRLRNPEKTLLSSAWQRAKVGGLEFNLAEEDVVIPEYCPVFGTRLERTYRHGQRSPNAPSLDRLEPTRGYVRGNVWVISWRANDLKRDATLYELRRLADAVEAQQTRMCSVRFAINPFV